MQFNDVQRKLDEISRFPDTWKWRVSKNGLICLTAGTEARNCLITVGRAGSPAGSVTILIREGDKSRISRCSLMDLLTKQIKGFPPLSSLDRKVARESSVCFDERRLEAMRQRTGNAMTIGSRS